MHYYIILLIKEKDNDCGKNCRTRRKFSISQTRVCFWREEGKEAESGGGKSGKELLN